MSAENTCRFSVNCCSSSWLCRRLHHHHQLPQNPQTIGVFSYFSEATKPRDINVRVSGVGNPTMPRKQRGFSTSVPLFQGMGFDPPEHGMGTHRESLLTWLDFEIGILILFAKKHLTEVQSEGLLPWCTAAETNLKPCTTRTNVGIS